MKKGKILLFVLICMLSLAGCLDVAGEFGETGKTGETRVNREPGTRDELTDSESMAENLQMLEAFQGCYAYDTLSEAQKVWYADIYRILSGHLTEGDLQESKIGELGTEDVDFLFRCVMNDHPELFYVSGYSQVEYTRNDKLYRLGFEGTYTMDAQEAEIRRQQIDAYVQECLTGISQEASQYEKVKYVYEYLIENTEYRLDAPQNQNICSVFISRESVCQGYAKAMQYLLERLDVPCTLVLGYVDGVGHAWNLVQVDGEYYHVDTTWGDASYRSGEGESLSGYPSVNYDYLCVTTEQLCKTHEIANVVEVPECTSLEANYYVVECAYFTHYDEREIGAFLAAEQADGEDAITIKCADEAVYEEIYTQLITNQLVFQYLEVKDGVLAYSDNKEQLSITFWMVEE